MLLTFYNITVFTVFCLFVCLFDQINSSLVSRRDFWPPVYLFLLIYKCMQTMHTVQKSNIVSNIVKYYENVK